MTDEKRQRLVAAQERRLARLAKEATEEKARLKEIRRQIDAGERPFTSGDAIDLLWTGAFLWLWFGAPGC